MASTRFTTSLTPQMAEQLRRWGRELGARSDAETLRMVVAFALTQPQDRSLAMAYQQVRAQLWDLVQGSFTDAWESATNQVKRRR